MGRLTRSASVSKPVGAERNVGYGKPSDDQGHHVSLFQKESLEPTPMKRKQRTAGGVDGEALARGKQRMREAVTMSRRPGMHSALE